MTIDYYPLQKNWRRVKTHIADPAVQKVLQRDFNRFTFGRWGREFKAGMTPTEFESCDWQSGHVGRKPAYWAYTKHAACHFLVNFALRLAEKVEPGRSWRILTSQAHSTVWDGEATLFDFNFRALGVSPEECFRLANRRELKPGREIRVHFAQHWSEELRGRENKTQSADLES